MVTVTFWVPGHILIHSPIFKSSNFFRLICLDLGLVLYQFGNGRFVVEGNDGRKHSYLNTKTKLDIP